jgi:hypothetical protein
VGFIHGAVSKHAAKRHEKPLAILHQLSQDATSGNMQAVGKEAQ